MGSLNSLQISFHNDKNKTKNVQLPIIYRKLASKLHLELSLFYKALGKIDIYSIFLSVPSDKRNKCDCCDIQRLLTEIKNIHNNNIQKNQTTHIHYWKSNKCFCRICSAIYLYDPHCTCGIYEDQLSFSNFSYSCF